MLIELSEGKLKEMSFRVKLEDRADTKAPDLKMIDVYLVSELDGVKLCSDLTTISDSSVIYLGEIEKLDSNEWKYQSCHAQTLDPVTRTQKKRILAVGKLIEIAIEAQTRKHKREDLTNHWQKSLVVNIFRERIFSMLVEKDDLIETLPQFQAHLKDFKPGHIIYALTYDAETMLQNAHLSKYLADIKASFDFFERDNYTEEERNQPRAIQLLQDHANGRGYIEKIAELIASHKDDHTRKLCQQFRWSNGNVMANLAEQSARNASSEVLKLIERIEWKLEDTLNLFN